MVQNNFFFVGLHNKTYFINFLRKHKSAFQVYEYSIFILIIIIIIIIIIMQIGTGVRGETRLGGQGDPLGDVQEI